MKHQGRYDQTSYSLLSNFLHILATEKKALVALRTSHHSTSSPLSGLEPRMLKQEDTSAVYRRRETARGTDGDFEIQVDIPTLRNDLSARTMRRALLFPESRQRYTCVNEGGGSTVDRGRF